MVIVRVDKQTGKGSALDVIRMVNGTRSNHAAAHLRTILERYPDINLSKTKIDGKGRQTPVGTLEELASIIEKCPVVRNTSVAPSRLRTILAHVKKVMKNTPIVTPLPYCVKSEEYPVSKIESDSSGTRFSHKLPRNAFGPLSAMVSDTIEMKGSSGSVSSVLMLLLGVGANEVNGLYSQFAAAHPEIKEHVECAVDGAYASAEVLHAICESFEVSRPRRNFVHKCIDRDVLGLIVTEDAQECDLRHELHKRMISTVDSEEQPRRKKKQKVDHDGIPPLSPAVRGAMRAYSTLKHLGLVPGMTQNEVTQRLKRSSRGVALMKYLGQ